MSGCDTVFINKTAIKSTFALKTGFVGKGAFMEKVFLSKLEQLKNLYFNTKRLEMDKYYLKTYPKFAQGNELVRNNSNLELFIDEAGSLPCFNLYFRNLLDGSIKRPKSDQYEKYKEIPQGVFADHFQEALKKAKADDLKDGEFYLEYNTLTGVKLVTFQGEKQVYHVVLDINTSIEFTNVSLCWRRGLGRRHSYRKNLVQINGRLFESIVNETIKFLAEEKDYQNYFVPFFKKIKSILSSKYVEKITEDHTDVSCLIRHLEYKVNELNDTLVNNDSDTEKTRAFLRGKMAGIEYSLMMIKKHYLL